MRINFPFTTPCLNDVPGLLALAISSTAFAEIPSEAKLCLKLSRSLVLGFGSRSEGILDPEDSLGCCLIEVTPDVSKTVGMYLLLGCMDLLSTTGKMVSDGMLLMEKYRTLGIPTLHKFIEMLSEIVPIYSSLGNFWKPNLP